MDTLILLRDSFAAWVASTRLSEFATAHEWPWFPVCETLHFIGLSFLVGGIGVLDLRILGIAKKLPLAPLHRFVPWAIGGFVVNLLSGTFFFLTNPSVYASDSNFDIKMLFILLGGVNVLVFYLTVFRETVALGPGEDASLSAKIIAAVSLFLWVGVMFWGRLLGVSKIV